MFYPVEEKEGEHVILPDGAIVYSICETCYIHVIVQENTSCLDHVCYSSQGPLVTPGKF